MSTPTVPVGNARAPVSAAGTANGEQVMDEAGHFHVTDAPIDLRHYTAEAWIAFAFFWLLALTVFYQFFTRYALNVNQKTVYRLAQRREFPEVGGGAEGSRHREAAGWMMVPPQERAERLGL